MSEHRHATEARSRLPPGIPSASAVDGQASTENFPVALRVLPRRVRTHLLAIYGFARLADDLGDDYHGDRLAALDWLEGELDAAAAGRAEHPLLARLTPTIDAYRLDLQPFRDLIEANRRDQRQPRYESFDELLDYCRQSANPVGRLVLAVFGVSDPAAVALSDDVCSGLQVVEHLQDVGEDLEAGRVYLPQADLDAFGCSDADLAQPRASPALRRVVALECDRATELLGSGDSLAARVVAQPRVAVAGFVGGGRAALDSIHAAGHDVLGHRCRPSGRNVARHATSILWAAGRARRAERRGRAAA